MATRSMLPRRFGACLFGLALVLGSRAGAIPSDTRGTDFWLAFTPEMPVAAVLIAATEPTVGRIEVPGLGISIPFSAVAGQGVRIELPPTVVMSLEGIDTTENKGVHIEASNEISVFGFGPLYFFESSYLALPTEVLGCEYTILAGPNWNDTSCDVYLPWYLGGEGCGSDLAVLAVMDDTRVTITPSVTTGMRPAGVPYDIVLNRGQIYRLANIQDGPENDLSGTRVVSDRPVAVYGGFSDHGYPYNVSQLPPASYLGADYLFIPYAERTAGDILRVVALNDGTEVRINGALAATLDKWKVFQEILTEPSWITSNYPVMAAQYMQEVEADGITGDPEMMVMVATDRFMTDYLITTDDKYYWHHYLNIAAPTAALGAVILDGDILSATSFSAIGSSGYSAIQVGISNGPHTISCPSPVGVYIYGMYPYCSYAHAGGMELDRKTIPSNSRIALSPNYATPLIGSEICLDIKVTDIDGAPKADASLELVCSGANSWGLTLVSDENGEAVHCYKSQTAGKDEIVASLMCGYGPNLTARAQIHWTEPSVQGLYRGAIRVFPNPFDRKSAVRGTVKFEGLELGGSVTIYSVRGLKVWQGFVETPYILEWDGRNEGGDPVAPGTYMWLAESGDSKQQGVLIVE